MLLLNFCTCVLYNEVPLNPHLDYWCKQFRYVLFISLYQYCARKDSLEDDLEISSSGENVLPFKIDSDITKLPYLNEYDIDE